MERGKRMQLQECYDSIGGDYEEIKMRLGSDALIQRFALKFLKDSSYEKLGEALEKKDYGEAFRCAHTLKGVCQNLSFRCLSNSSGDLTELLRNFESAPVDEAACDRLWQQVSGDYSQVMDALRKLEQ